MEVSVHVHQGAEYNQNNNLNNVAVNGTANGGRMHHNHHHHKAPTSATTGHEVHSSNKHASNNNKDEKQKPSAEQTKQQTDKIMKAFLKSIVDKNGIAEQIRQESRQRYEVQRSGSAPQSSSLKVVTNYSQRPSTSEGRSTERQMPTRVPLREESMDEKLSKIMRGEIPTTYRLRSDASSDSADSELSKDARFKRSKSFSRAQRHSVVTELENKAPKTTSRRNSEDIPQTIPLESSLEDSLRGVGDKKAGSPISHTRAVSDPVIVRHDVTGKHKSQSKEKEKDKDKKKFWKRKKKKKEAQKSKEEVGDQVTSSQDQKINRNHSDRVTREDSAASSKRRSPSPPPSPKRTPKLFRRFSKRKKLGKAETPLSESSSSSKSTSRSKSLEFDAVNNETTSNKDSKSSSLPMEASLSTKTSSELKHREGRPQRSQASTVQVDSAGKKHRRNSEEVIRPDTLDLQQKKKPSAIKKLKKLLFDSSSSSSSDEDEDPKKNQHPAGSQKSVSRGQSLQEVPRRTPKPTSYGQPSVDDVRDRYQHRATKSMSDIDPMDKDCSEIALKLRRVAEQFVMHYGGPTGRTQTPESYRHELNRARHGKKPHMKKPVARAATLPTPPVHSHSMKAYFNMKKDNTTATDSRIQRRITRDEIDHRPTRSLDSPRAPNDPEQGSRWSDRIEDRAPRTRILEIGSSHTEPKRVHDRHVDRTDSPIPRPRSNAPPPRPQVGSGLPHSSRHHHHRHSPVRTDNSHQSGVSRGTPPPEPTRSVSPHLRASRSGDRHRGPSLDPTSHDHLVHHVHVERHRDTTVTMSSPGYTRRIITHVVEIEDRDDIESDAAPIPPGEIGGGDEDFAAAFADDDDDINDGTEIVRHREETTTVTEEATGPTRSLMRQRAATSPEIRPHLSFDDADDDELDDIEEQGAVGGADPEEEVMDEDELAKKISKMLQMRGDRMGAQLETPQIEEAINRTLARFSQDRVKAIMNRAISMVVETTSSHIRHPEVVQIALLFRMAQMFVQASTRPSFWNSVVNSMITPLVDSFGGWSRVQSSLDETEMEMTSLDIDEPGPSGLPNQQSPRRRKNEESDPDSDFD